MQRLPPPPEPSWSAWLRLVYPEIWPGNSGVKWPINLRLDIFRPLHGSHLASLLSSQLSSLWRAVNLSFSREVMHPSVPPSIQEQPWRGGQEVFTSKSFSKSRSAERVLDHLPKIHWALRFHWQSGKTQVRSCCGTWKPRPREEKIYMLVVFLCQVDPCLCTTFSLLWQLLWSEL